MIYCTCGHLLVEGDSNQNLSTWRLDALSIPHNVIKKGRPHVARHGITEAQKEHYVAHNARKRCLKRNYEGIHDRFLRDPENRDSQLKIGWTGEKCIEMDKLAQEDHSYRLSRGIFEISKTLVPHTKQFGQEYTEATSIRFPSRSHNDEPPPPRMRRRVCRTNSFSTVSKVAPFFLKFFMVELGNVQKLAELMRIIHFLKLFVAVGFVYS